MKHGTHWVLQFPQNLLEQSRPQPLNYVGPQGMAEGGGTSETCRGRKVTTRAYLRGALLGADPCQVQ